MLLCPRLLNLTRTNPDAARIDAIQAPPSSMIPAPPMLPSFGFSSGAQCRSLARIVNRGAPSPSFFLVASRETRRSAGAGLLERGMQLVSSALLASPASATCLPPPPSARRDGRPLGRPVATRPPPRRRGGAAAITSALNRTAASPSSGSSISVSLAFLRLALICFACSAVFLTLF